MFVSSDAHFHSPAVVTSTSKKNRMRLEIVYSFSYILYFYEEINHLKMQSYMTLNLEMVNDEGTNEDRVVFQLGESQLDF